jgi:hypothetical protein
MQRINPADYAVREVPMLEEMVSGFDALRNVENKREELEMFNELSFKIEHSRNEFASVEELEPISEELEDLQGVSDEIADILRQKFSETQDSLQDEEPGDESLEEKKIRLREEYEELAFDNNK